MSQPSFSDVHVLVGSSFTSPVPGPSVRATTANQGQGTRVKATSSEGGSLEGERLEKPRVPRPEVFSLEGSGTKPSIQPIQEFGRSESVGRVKDREKAQRDKATKSLGDGARACQGSQAQSSKRASVTATSSTGKDKGGATARQASQVQSCERTSVTVPSSTDKEKDGAMAGQGSQPQSTEKARVTTTSSKEEFKAVQDGGQHKKGHCPNGALTSRGSWSGERKGSCLESRELLPTTVVNGSSDRGPVDRGVKSFGDRELSGSESMGVGVNDSKGSDWEKIKPDDSFSGAIKERVESSEGTLDS